VTKKKNDNPYKENPILNRRPNQPLNDEQEHEAFAELYKCFSISEHDQNAQQKLLRSLLKTHVPIFRPKGPSGRRKVRTPLRMAILLLEFGEAQEKFAVDAVLSTLKLMSADPWWVENGFYSKRNILQAMRHDMRELDKSVVRERVEYECYRILLELVNWIKKTPEVQRAILEDEREDDPDSRYWADLARGTTSIVRLSDFVKSIAAYQRSHTRRPQS
jgi:predicted Fe-S protein YdhL (DUF1289 family)